MDSTDIDWPLLHRYAVGESTPAERKALERWAGADPEHRQLLEQVQRITRAAGATPEPVFDSHAAWARVDARTAAPPPVRTLRRQLEQRPLSPTWTAGTAIAAAVVVALGWPLAHRGPASQQFREFTTTPGNRTTVTLRDGTRLVLGPATRLRVPNDFGRAARIVELEGQAYFTVVHDEAHPFAVHARNAIATDIGTQFDVRAYPGDGGVRVAVIDGRVDVNAIGNRGRVGQLGAGDVAVIDTAVAIKHHANVRAMMAWVQGRLVFDNTPLPEVLRSVGRAYDVEVTLADTSLARRTVTASFDDDTVDEVLESIAKSVGARVRRQGRRAVVARQLGASHAPGSMSTVDAGRSHKNK